MVKKAVGSMELWDLKILGRLYYHIGVEPPEQSMIQSLSTHGVRPMDLVPPLPPLPRWVPPLPLMVGHRRLRRLHWQPRALPNQTKEEDYKKAPLQSSNKSIVSAIGVLHYLNSRDLVKRLVIGLSVGLLAPIISVGLGIAFSTIELTGSSTFLAGLVGAAVITAGITRSSPINENAKSRLGNEGYYEVGVETDKRVEREEKHGRHAAMIK
ncbi:hypothetical protein F5877DRAFT_84594 [Lentinula edodes]|nr:hypothetical protein F5877DRAFT_84594 [Lentinula edodes]